MPCRYCGISYPMNTAHITSKHHVKKLIEYFKKIKNRKIKNELSDYYYT